jgi:hypothetical protein
MTELEGAVQFADHLLAAPPEHLALETPEELIGVIDIAVANLEAHLPSPGLGWKLIDLELMKGQQQKRLLDASGSIL